MASLSVRDIGGSSRVTLPRPETTSRAPLKVFSLRIASNRRRVSASTSAVASRLEGVPRRMHNYGDQSSSSVSREKLDDWISGSVTEIVRNLRQAPLFVHVYSNGGADGDLSLVTEKAVKEEDWERVKGEWENGEKAMPEGVIFVEELEDKETEEDETGGSAARLWGLVVQGRGGKRGPPVCYLLKTFRVGSGTGIWSTHFYLVRVNGFRESMRSQLMNFWLCDGWGSRIESRTPGRVHPGNAAAY